MLEAFLFCFGHKTEERMETKQHESKDKDGRKEGRVLCVQTDSTWMDDKELQLINSRDNQKAARALTRTRRLQEHTAE